MEIYSREQRIEIIKIHYRNGENFTETSRKVQTLFGSNEAPSQQIIMNLVKSFESLGDVGDVNSSICGGKVKSAKNITTVIEKLAENRDGITLTEDGSSNVSTTANDNTNQLKPNNSISNSKAGRNLKRRRHQ